MSIEARDQVRVEPGDKGDPTIMAMVSGINKGIEGIQKTIEGAIEPLERGLAAIERARSELVKQLPKRYSEELSRVLGEGRLLLTGPANAKLLEEEQGPLLDTVTKALEKAREARTTLDRQRQARKDALTQHDDY